MAVAYRQNLLWLTPPLSGSVNLAMDSAETAFKRTLGATILSLRVQNGIRSQGALADALAQRGASVSEATVRRWEQGTSAPDAWEISRLCDLFGVEPVELIRPEPMTERERQLLRRAARQIHRSIDQGRGAD